MHVERVFNPDHKETRPLEPNITKLGEAPLVETTALVSPLA